MGSPVSGILLAAGAGERFGGPKADIVLDGERLLDRGVRVLREGGCAEVIAVVRPGTSVDGAVVVENPDPARGMGSSLRLAFAHATGDRAVVLLVDTPGIGPDAVRRIAQDPAPCAIATYDGRRGHPVGFDRPLWTEVADLAVGDVGARAFVRAHPELVGEVPCDGRPDDIDTVADLDAWRARTR